MLNDDDLATVKDLQHRIFYMAIPRSGFDIDSNSSFPRRTRASISERVQVAAEIIHVQPGKYGGAAVARILRIDDDLEKMRAIEKLSAVFGKLPENLQGILVDIALSKTSHPDDDIYLQANKFLVIARDHMSENVQRDHEDFWHSESKTDREKLNRSIVDDMIKEFRQRTGANEKIMEKDHRLLIVNEQDRVRRIEERSQHRPSVSKNRIHNLLKSAYILRRITERALEEREFDHHALRVDEPGKIEPSRKRNRLSFELDPNADKLNIRSDNKRSKTEGR